MILDGKLSSGWPVAWIHSLWTRVSLDSRKQDTSLYLSLVTKVSKDMCGFTTWFAKNWNLQGFKELQYVDLQLDLQRITTWKVVRYFFKSLKYVSRTAAILSWLVLDFLVHFCSCFIHLEKRLRHDYCLDYTYSCFFKTRSFRKAGSGW